MMGEHFLFALLMTGILMVAFLAIALVPLLGKPERKYDDDQS